MSKKSTQKNSTESIVDLATNSEVKPPRKKPGKKKGSPKTGGRKKGTPNKSKLKFECKLAAQDFDVAEEMVALYRETTDINVKLRIIELIARHTIPVPKPVDPEGSSKEKIEINYIKDK